ncbi:MAG: LuxR C-terminal-related transcriptional regulator [Candidatus Chromulinivorax sp.]|nr:LuxR C-terminal-related transcriptional regulator [Candidatus Chromulinivorax sp.]
MNIAIDLKNHFCLQHKEQLKQINSPLKHIGLDAYCYTSIDKKTGERYVLTDSPEWTHFAYNTSLYNSEVIEKIEVMHLTKWYVWSDFDQNIEWENARLAAKTYGLSHGLTLLLHTPDRLNMYYASTSRSLGHDRILLNIRKQLMDFIPYFHCAAKDLIADSAKHTFTIKEQQTINLSCVTSYDFTHFYNEIEINRLVINDEGDFLTHQEALCVYLSINGKVAKQISSILNVSTRTVESHIANARKKIKVHSNETLLSRLVDSIYLNHLMFYGKGYFQNK